MEVIMQLKKQSNPSARWDFEANSWSIGTSDEYQWSNERTKEYSPWMDLDTALIWIKKRDESQKTS
jgi:hypothetical protein